MANHIKNFQSKQGFTLLELSIVLVIIGLIIGGVTVGQELIRSAELNSVVSDVNKYKTAINTFKLKYNALPGDMDNAEDYWGTAATGAACQTTAGTATQTCNGDGDGTIDYMHSTSGNTLHESWRAWQHLSNAEIVPGSYTGISITGCSDANHCSDPGGNVPSSGAASNAGWHLFLLASSGRGKAEARNTLALGNPGNLTGNGLNGRWNGLILNPADMKSIEDKMDDGVPNTGSITNMNTDGSAVGIWNPNCVNLTGGIMSYNLSYDDVACNLYADLD